MEKISTEDAEERIRKAFGVGVASIVSNAVSHHERLSTKVGERGVVDASLHEIASGAAQLVMPCGDNEPYYDGPNAPVYTRDTQF